MANVRELARETVSATVAIDIADSNPVQIIDGSWAFKPEAISPHFLQNTTQSLDLATIKRLPPAKRTPERLAEFFRTQGLDQKHTPLFVYDRVGLFSAAWVWWMLLRAGHEAWLVDDVTGAPTSPLDTVEPSGRFHPQPPLVEEASIDNLLSSNAQIIDARSPGRFAGTEPEPREGLRSGHMPGAINIHYPRVKDGNSIKSAEALRDLFVKENINLNAPIITTCGSGVTACLLAFSLWRAGAHDVRVYIGSWAEYGASNFPVETGS